MQLRIYSKGTDHGNKDSIHFMVMNSKKKEIVIMILSTTISKAHNIRHEMVTSQPRGPSPACYIMEPSFRPHPPAPDQ